VIRSITRYAFGKGAIPLAQGFPDFDPPAEVLAEAEKAMRSGRSIPTGMSPSPAELPKP